MTKLALRSTRSTRIAVDIGGTFTDGVAEMAPGGRIWVAKTLTTPRDPGDAVSTVVADLLRQIYASATPVAADAISEVVHGTTLVTNTLIERSGAKTGLVVTSGMRDTLDIGRELRYDLYDLDLRLPAPLVKLRDRFEVSARMGADGRIIRELDRGAIEKLITQVAGRKFKAIAVCLLHSYLDDSHECELADLLRRSLPGTSISISSRVAREVREFERTSTTVANAYVQPLMQRYLNRLEKRLQELGVAAPLRVMVSSGGFTSASAAAEVPILLLESGPAGGVLSAVNTGLQAGVGDILAFDMGGTTAKACVSTGGEPLTAHNFEAARLHRFKRGSGLPILIPSIDLIEIGAGGGSVAHVNELGLLTVGPESSGAEPGPACYSLGGRGATVTDADLLLGYLNADNFLGGEMRLSRQNAEKALATLGKQLGFDAVKTAWGIYDIVNENMACAARVHIAEKGHDPRKLTMVATGGAGPVHAVEVARKLGISRVLSTMAAGAGSCLGFLAAPARVDRAWSRIMPLAELDWTEVRERMDELYAGAHSELRSAGAAVAGIGWMLSIEMRYVGQGFGVNVPMPYERIGVAFESSLLRAFEARYRTLYGQTVPNGVPEVVTWRLTGSSGIKSRRYSWGDQRRRGPSGEGAVGATGERMIFLPVKQRFAKVLVYDRYSLPAGATLRGPVVLEERESTLLVPVPSLVRVLKDLTISVELGGKA